MFVIHLLFTDSSCSDRDSLKAFMSAWYSRTFKEPAIGSVAATKSNRSNIKVANKFVYTIWRAPSLGKTSITHCFFTY